MVGKTGTKKANSLSDNTGIIAKQGEREGFTKIVEQFKKHGQEHMFTNLSELDQSQKAHLQQQLESFDLEDLLTSFQAAKGALNDVTNRLQPSPLSMTDVIVPDKEKLEAAWKHGLGAISNGQVAVITLAGGQGTRLGSSDPKGCYNISLPSGKSLFELQALRLKKLAQIANVPSIPWFIMTSKATDESTRHFFAAKNFFGLSKESINFFKQGQLPTLNEEGKILLESKADLALSPNGNGGIFLALKKEGILDVFKAKGIKFVHMFCVDNALVRVADPYFMGACIEKGTDCAAKAIIKTDPNEFVGIFCRRKDGKLIVAEYSELDTTLVSQTDQKGNLIFSLANIANHFFTTDFLEQVATIKLPFHLARKKIPSIDPKTGLKSDTLMGFKLEAFIFDVFEYAKQPIIYQSDRKEEFAPLKNAPGAPKDSPEYCRQMLLDLHANWARKAGATCIGPIEISPLLSYAGENLGALAGKKLGGFIEETNGVGKETSGLGKESSGPVKKGTEHVKEDNGPVKKSNDLAKESHGSIKETKDKSNHQPEKQANVAARFDPVRDLGEK